MAALPQLPPQQAEHLYALAFEVNAEAKLLALQEELRTHTYRPGRPILFVTAGPKPREVFAADFRDRIVHHFLVSHLRPGHGGQLAQGGQHLQLPLLGQASHSS